METAKNPACAYPDFCELIARDQGGWWTHALFKLSVHFGFCCWNVGWLLRGNHWPRMSLVLLLFLFNVQLLMASSYSCNRALMFRILLSLLLDRSLDFIRLFIKKELKILLNVLIRSKVRARLSDPHFSFFSPPSYELAMLEECFFFMHTHGVNKHFITHFV